MVCLPGLSRPMLAKRQAFRALLQNPPRLPPSPVPSQRRNPCPIVYGARPTVKSRRFSDLLIEPPERHPTNRSSCLNEEALSPTSEGGAPYVLSPTPLTFP